MVFDDLCLKIYFWPFLSYLASLKGLCPFYPPGYFPIITLPPDTDLTTSTPIPPTFQPTPPTTTTLPPCPADPLVCLPGGERPIPYCPCIDPRQQNGQSTGVSNMMAMTSTTTSAEMATESLMNLQLRLGPPPVVMNTDLRLGPSYPPPVLMDTEIMIFSRLDNTNRRKRKKRGGLMEY